MSEKKRDQNSTRVIVADDHAGVRAGIRRLLESSPDLLVIGEAKDGIEALELVENLKPDVLLLDVEMPLLDGRQVATKLKERKSQVKILVLSSYNNSQYISSMLSNGVAGYITKDEAPAILVKAVLGVANGEKGWFSQEVVSKISDWHPKTSKS